MLILAPLAGGGWPLVTLIPLLAVASVALVLTVWQPSSKSINVPVFAIVLWALGAMTVVQAIRWSPGGVGLVSPRAAQMYTEVGSPYAALSYEVQASWREASKYFLYAITALVAYLHARSRGSVVRIARALVVAGLLSALIAVVHRVLGVDRLFGLLPEIPGNPVQITTFVNPNHSAAFMTLCTFAGIGWGLHTKKRAQRVAAFVSAAICTAVGVAAMSKGGIIGLFLGLLLFGVVTWRTGHVQRQSVRRTFFGAAALASITTALTIFLRPERLEHEVIDAGAGWLGMGAKLAGMRDVGPVIQDHLLSGIGRGAFVSVYPAYQSDPRFQLTYHFPENFILQWLVEWGVVVGGLCIVGALFALGLRFRRTKRLTVLALLSGVAAVLVHNLVDFNLELPGLAIPVIVCVAAASSRSQYSLRLDAKIGPIVALLCLFLVPAAFALSSALQEPTLDDDLRALDQAVSQAQAAISAEKKPAPIDLDLASVAHRHPSSAHVAVSLAYLAEFATPPDYKTAARHAERSMRLAPQQVDAYLLTGRLLVKRGFRKQGFGELRTAWSQASDRKVVVVDQVLSLARSVPEALSAVPRGDDGFASVGEVARLARRLLFHNKPKVAAQVLVNLDLDGADPIALRGVTEAATRAGAFTQALEALANLQVLEPQDAELRFRRVRLLARLGRTEEAREVLGEPKTGRELGLAIDFAMAEKNWDEARRLIDHLTKVEPGPQAWLATAQLERGLGHSADAIAVLSKGLQRRPHDVKMRFLRASLLAGIGRPREAKADTDSILRRQPQHAGALRLQTQLKGALRTGEDPNSKVAPSSVER